MGTVDSAAQMMHGRVLSGSPQARWSGAALDSRRVRGDELFFALPGEHSDGHLFVEDALERGAAAAVVKRDLSLPAGTLIRVPDVYEALHLLTVELRRRAPRQLVAVTGSVGKTTTKELLADMLGERFRVARSPGNLNNLYGFPLALLGIPDDTEWMVAEMGMSTPGELGAVSRLGRPDVALFTNVRPVHLEGLGSLRAIARAKAELLEGLAPGGLVVANADDPEVRWIADRHDGPVAWYSRSGAADSTVEGVEAAPAGGTRFHWLVGGAGHPVELSLHGDYNVWNFLAAATCAHALGVEPAAIVAAAGRALPASGRGVVHRLPGDVTLVDDSYNSNPAALAEALRGAASLSGGRRWAVLGDMLELGEESERFHREGGELAARLGFSPLLGVGDEARALVAAASAGGSTARWFRTAADAAADLPALERGDVVLVKGSRGVGLERVVEAVRERGGDV
ncbi:MAG: UDP-N-acetylmuramoyl-tripeptide--D-alanyl-D-alanine ligase [Thermoanaerobaculia bacterium]